MGRDYTPTNAIKYRDQTGWHKAAFKGRANDKTLAAHVQLLNASHRPGGCNEHVSRSLGFMPHVSQAYVVEQATGKIKAVYEAPTFQAV